MKILSSYAGICCPTWHVSHDIHQNIEILMDFLSQNFVNPDIDRDVISYNTHTSIIQYLYNS